MMIQNAEQFRKYTSPETFEKIVDFDSLGHMWVHCAKEYSDRIAIECGGEKYTYAQLDQDAAALRGALAEAGIQPGDRIAVYAANSYDFVKSFLAAATAGCPAVILPPHLDETAVFGCCMMYGAKAVIYQNIMEEKVAFAKGRCPQIAFLCADSKAAEAPVYFADPKAPCVLMFTGGTTGKSKVAQLNHSAILQGVINGCYGYEHVFGQRYLLVLPLSHIFGLVRNLLTSLYTGSTLFICLNNKDMFRDVAMFRPTILVLVPALAEMALMLSKKFQKNMLGDDLKYIICGAAMVAPYLIDEYAKLGVTLFPGYGLTESANLVSGNPESLKKPDSIGLPYPNQELKIVDGELWLRGRNMLDCYIGQDEAAWTEDGWFRTGDLVRMDDEGYLYIIGRTKEVIILSDGENVSPAELEARFNALSFIQDSQVFEDVDSTGQHFLALEVVPRMTELGGLGENPMKTIEEKLWEVNAQQRPAERVSRIVIRDQDFERSPSMKIVRYKKC